MFYSSPYLLKISKSVTASWARFCGFMVNSLSKDKTRSITMYQLKLEKLLQLKSTCSDRARAGAEHTLSYLCLKL